MKHMKQILVASFAVFITLFSSCTKETIMSNDDEQGPVVSADISTCDPCPIRFTTSNDPGQTGDGCGCYLYPFDLKDGSGNTADGSGIDYGQIEIVTTANEVVFLFTTNNPYYFSSFVINYGPAIFSVPVIPLRQYYTYSIPLSSLPSLGCNQVSVTTDLVTVDIFGMPSPGPQVHLSDGNANSTNFCPSFCPFSSISGNLYVANGPAGSACTTLSANMSGGMAPFTYQWSTGATTATISVCPTATTTYSVTISEAGGLCSNSSATVNYVSASISGCTSVVNGIPGRDCSTLTANASGGLGATGYLWSNGATTQSINVCPTSTTTYTVTVTDGSGVAPTAQATVHYSDIRCGNNNDKVTVCKHLPNGNTVEICIALPAAIQMVNSGNATWGPCNFVDPCQ